MKKGIKRFLAVVLSIVMLISCTSVVSFAADSTVVSSIGETVSRGFYEALNSIVENLVSAICKIYPNPPDWLNLEDYDSDEIGFLSGRDTYQTQAGENNYWSLGYASESIVPDDVDTGIYNLGRDLNNKMAKGVYDDQRIRVVVIDDNSGEGAVVIGSIDALGVTSTDARAIRKAVVDYCKTNDIAVASVNICATHSHSALDTQGVSTGFFKKLMGNFVYNALGIDESLSGFEAADYFKSYFISQSIEAVKNAFADVEKGTLSFASIDCSEIIKDKRGLISKEDIPDTACFKFVSDRGEETYIADISCHPTSFSANNGLVSSDYIYTLDNYIKSNTNGNFVMVAGALGQLSRDIEVDTSDLSEWETMGASAKYLGEAFGEYILNAEYKELAPVLNVTHRELFVYPENSILILACEIRLVNNRCFVDSQGKTCMATEMGYVEFGNEIGLALFPAEFYPETFWGDDITGNTTWDGTEWKYDSLYNSVDGVKVYCVSLVNDEIGYVLTDNNFAFMGHIIGDGIADEVLSVGKHTGSYLVGEYYSMINDYVK